MRNSVLSVLFAAALFSECYTSSEAIPTGKTEDAIALEQDALASLLNEEAAAENILVPETAILGRSGGTKIIVVGDAGLWRNMRAMERGLPLYKLRAAAAAAAAGPEGAMTLDRRDAGQDLSPGVSIVRRDTMRCMVGRVYRPCWEA